MNKASTLVIDIGGTGLKMISVKANGEPINERSRKLTPKPAAPQAILKILQTMIATQPARCRVSVGFPGVVKRGIVLTAPNLGTEAWRGYDLAAAVEEAAGAPTRVINDAELQGYGVIDNDGVELVVTLGTGVGTGLYVDGRLVPNFELGHHPWRKGDSYEDRLGNAGRKTAGNRKWRRWVTEMLVQLNRTFNPDMIHLGGGNARKLDASALPANVRLFTNVSGLSGGVALWQDKPCDASE